MTRLCGLSILEHRRDGAAHLDVLLHQGKLCQTFSLHPIHRSLHAAVGPQWSWYINKAHRRFYMNYTGPVSRGRGAVQCVWSGRGAIDYQAQANQRYVVTLGRSFRLRIILKTNGLACLETQSRLPRWLAKSSR